VLLSLLLAALPLAAWSLFVEPDQLVVARETIALPRWPDALDGLRVVAISDIHAGAPFVDAAKLRRLVAAANSERPDLVVLLGDYVIQGVLGGQFIAPEQAVRELGALRGRLGVYAVLGNHDHWLDAPRVRRSFESAGIQMVDDKAVHLEQPGRGFWLVGIHDIWTGWPDVARLLRQVSSGEPTLAITHNPDIFPALPASVDLLFAGHTHGGQVRLPLLGAPIVPSSYGQRFARGHVIENGRHLFVTSGVGTSVVPARFGVPPEIALVVIRSGSASAR
jgi:predicted MPP superfamily phosphohydrolase